MSDNVALNHPEYNKFLSNWHLLKDTIEGETSVKERSNKYLPQPCGMDSPDYAEYAFRARFPDVLSKTIDGLLGRIFRRNPQLNLPPLLQNIASQIGGEGTSINTLARKVCRNCIAYGRYGLLVDFDNQKQEPRIMRYSPFSIVNWKEHKGKLQLVVLEEMVFDSEDADNNFGHNYVQKRLVLSLRDGIYTSQIFIQKDEEWQALPVVTPSIAGKTLDYIPFIFISSYSNACGVEKPLLFGLAKSAIHFYNTSADLRHSLHLCALATPYIKLDVDALAKVTDGENGDNNFDEITLKLGGSKGITLPGNSEIKFAEVSGNGMAALSTELNDIRKDMVAQGARVLQDTSGLQIAAETARIMQSGETSSLASLANNVSDGLEKALKICATWLNENPDDVSLSLNTEFFETKLSPNELNALVSAWQNGAYNSDVLQENLHKAGIK